MVAIGAMSVGTLVLSAAPAAADTTVDPFSTNCQKIASLAAQNHAPALQALAGLLVAGTGASASSVKIQTHFPAVTFQTVNGSCTINVHP
jgi:hypothetical protein